MRPLAISLASACLGLSGCADPLEQRSGQEVQFGAALPVWANSVLNNATPTIRQRNIAFRKLTPEA